MAIKLNHTIVHSRDPKAAAEQAVRLARAGTAQTICVHGDTPGSDDLAARIRAGFEAAGVSVKAIGLS